MQLLAQAVGAEARSGHDRVMRLLPCLRRSARRLARRYRALGHELRRMRRSVFVSLQCTRVDQPPPHRRIDPRRERSRRLRASTEYVNARGTRGVVTDDAHPLSARSPVTIPSPSSATTGWPSHWWIDPCRTALLGVVPTPGIFSSHWLARRLLRNGDRSTDAQARQDGGCDIPAEILQGLLQVERRRFTAIEQSSRRRWSPCDR